MRSKWVLWNMPMIIIITVSFLLVWTTQKELTELTFMLDVMIKVPKVA